MEHQAAIFDLDGTLTKPYLDFDAMRREIGLPTESRTPILEAIECMDVAERASAQAILDRHEQQAARASELQESVIEVLDAIRAQGFRLGLSTRNSRACTEIVLRQHELRFDDVHTRDDGIPKPSAEPILTMCRKWSVQPRDVWTIGDYLFDIQAGRVAGTKTVLMIGDGPCPDYADQADHVIRHLRELLLIMGITTWRTV